MKQKIIPILSVLVGVLAFALTWHYLRGKERAIEELRASLYAGARQIAVVAAAHDIPSRTVVKAEDLGQRRISEREASERVVTIDQANLILGRKTLFEIKERQPILWSEIEGGAPSETALAAIVTPGMRAISLSIGGAEAVSGMVQPNDRVDVLGTFSFPSKKATGEMESVTLTVLQDVTVLAAGQRMAGTPEHGRGAASSGFRTVTVEVTPSEAEVLVFAEQLKGRLTLALRNASDVSFESDLPEVNFEHIEKRLPELNMNRQKNIRHKRSP
jgi:pilus assembly protein CpaB